MMTVPVRHLIPLTLLASCLTGCGGSSSDTPPQSSNYPPVSSTPGTTQALILDGTQQQVSDALSQLASRASAATPAGTPIDLGGFLLALDPTLKGLLNGPDGLLTNLLVGAKLLANDPSPAGVQAAATALQAGLAALPVAITGLSRDLPCALATLIGNRSAGCQGGTPAEQLQRLLGSFSGGNNPFANTPLSALGVVGGAGTPVGGPTGTPMDNILQPLLLLVGTPASGSNPAIPAQPLTADRLAALGEGLAWLGDQLVDAYNFPPGSEAWTRGANVVMSLGATLADLSTLQGNFDASNGNTLGQQIGERLGSVSVLLTAPTGLLGTLARASGSNPLVLKSVLGSNQLSNLLGTGLATGIDSALSQSAWGGSMGTLTNTLSQLGCAVTLLQGCATTTGTGGSQLSSDLSTLLAQSLSLPVTPTSWTTVITSAVSTSNLENQQQLNTLTTLVTAPVNSLNNTLTGLLGLLSSNS